MDLAGCEETTPKACEARVRRQKRPESTQGKDESPDAMPTAGCSPVQGMPISAMRQARETGMALGIARSYPK